MTEKCGEVSLAGMEDFHAMLRTLKSDPSFRWGMIGTANPLKWNTDFPVGSERLSNHLKKVARQETVMKEYAKQIFPELSYKEVMNRLCACYHQR